MGAVPTDSIMPYETLWDLPKSVLDETEKVIHSNPWETQYQCQPIVLPRLEIVRGPHLLFRSKNDDKTYGITVKSLLPWSECERLGFSRQWDVNDFSILNCTPDYLAGLLMITVADAMCLQAEIAVMVERQES